jgi:hypothetical protein
MKALRIHCDRAPAVIAIIAILASLVVPAFSRAYYKYHQLIRE